MAREGTNAKAAKRKHARYILSVFQQLSKAFACVDHENLLTSLHFCRIREVSEDWFRSHLTNRRQKVEVKIIQFKIFSLTGEYETWRSPSINSTACIIHNTYK
jgi:hypothetical protein